MDNLFFFTDVHGDWELYQAAKQFCLQAPQSTIVYGGDACDRGHDGFRIMIDLLNTPQIIYLMGNHEEMFVWGTGLLSTIIKSDITTADEVQSLFNNIQDKNFPIYAENGCLPTLKDWILCGCDKQIVSLIKELPLTYSYNNIDFCHAGGRFATFQRVAVEKKMAREKDKEEVLWDRKYWSLGWENDRICIHGHTPTPFLPAVVYGRDKSIENIHPCIWGELLGQKAIRGGKKIDMDAGTPSTHKLFVLNCLTGEVTGFLKDITTKTVSQFQQYKLF